MAVLKASSHLTIAVLKVLSQSHLTISVLRVRSHFTIAELKGHSHLSDLTRAVLRAQSSRYHMAILMSPDKLSLVHYRVRSSAVAVEIHTPWVEDWGHVFHRGVWISTGIAFWLCE